MRLGHAGAIYYAALLHRTGDEVLEIVKSQEAFHSLLERACEAGDANAFFCLGDMYFHGSEGVEQDEGRAFRCFLEASKLGHADAMCSLGAMYYIGIGVGVEGPDHRLAFDWYQRAADKGGDDGGPHRQAWGNLASMYALGHGVPRSEETAKHILRFLDSVTR